MLLSDTPCAQVNSLSIMGEEKPEEELMGKRKSSPRLSATTMRRYPTSFPFLSSAIHSTARIYVYEKFYWLGTDVIV
ncbi:hypothetical protein EDM52_03465 [Brevibacillus invocatus]|uniref:Uncharacterized protein n=1 Tax=Brevibacillus invocatus TaxID=173959 RepID=A0A3M8CLH5_9BACL|nr:hypothetical protein EDM52_03465 [Brevibacillus invocatus]